MEIYDRNSGISRIQSLLLEVVIEKIVTGNRPNEKSRWSEIIKRYENMTHEPPSIARMARWEGYSESRFRTLFKLEKGIGPSAFFLNLKMEKAAAKLRETVLPIKEIAALHGYREVSHFNRAFSGHFGISPGRYRKKNRFRG